MHLKPIIYKQAQQFFSLNSPNFRIYLIYLRKMELLGFIGILQVKSNNNLIMKHLTKNRGKGFARSYGVLLVLERNN